MRAFPRWHNQGRLAEHCLELMIGNGDSRQVDRLLKLRTRGRGTQGGEKASGTPAQNGASRPANPGIMSAQPGVAQDNRILR